MVGCPFARRSLGVVTLTFAMMLMMGCAERAENAIRPAEDVSINPAEHLSTVLADRLYPRAVPVDDLAQVAGNWDVVHFSGYRPPHLVGADRKGAVRFMTGESVPGSAATA
ncbi:hypothetical protein ABVV53_05375 [Novosphingobium sp. RD2P27]|uniref:Uncharacterized protein n=1 Tax=Novosphingobium kalidii TaxID=3230299 RepID=A0ABV2CZ53_9SPHN